MGKTLEVAADRAFDQSKTIIPAELARGVYMRNAPSLQALKLMHLMIATAGGRMAEEVRHELRLSDIRKIEGMRNHDRSSLTPLFAELSAATLIIDNTEKKLVTIGGLMEEAQINYRDEAETGDLVVSWWFRRTFRVMAENSNHWAILDRQTVFHLGSKYSVLLFQHVASLTGLERISSKTFSVDELRAVLGVATGKLARFADLNARAILPSIEEINQLSRLHLTVTPHKIGRSVAKVTIAWQVKEDPTQAKQEVGRHSIGRKARREGTDETPVVAFPASGSIEFEDRWKALKRAAGCNMDNAMIAEKFRGWCAAKGIALDGRGIEKKFSDYCASVGKV